MFFGSRGFFADYNARPNDPLTQEVAKVWVEGVQSILGTDEISPNELATQVKEAEAATNGSTLSGAEFAKLLERPDTEIRIEREFRRQDALETLYQIVLQSVSFVSESVHKAG